MSESTHPIWTPSSDRVLASNLWAFGAYAAETYGIEFRGYESLHEWSVSAPDQFWAAIWSFTGVLGNPGERVVETTAPFWATRFFLDATINFAENLLRPNDDSAAILFAREDGARSAISWSELHDLVARIQDGLRRAGVGQGDRVAAWVPNIPEALALMLACAGIGAIFSSCSPDFGVQGVVDRFGQIQPVVLVGVDGYIYEGKIYDCRDGLAVISSRLPTVRTTVVIGYIDPEPDLSSVRGSASWDGVAAVCASRWRRGRVAAVRSSAVRPLLLGDDRAPEVHRAPGWGRPPQASGRAPSPLRREAGRPGVLLHYHRLDDVELAGFRACDRGDRRAV